MFTVQILHPQATYRYITEAEHAAGEKGYTYPRDLFWIKVPTDIVRTAKFQSQVHVPEDMFTEPHALEDCYEIDGHCYFWCPINHSEKDRPFIFLSVGPYSAMNSYKDEWIRLGPRTKIGFGEPKGVSIESISHETLEDLRWKISRSHIII